MIKIFSRYVSVGVINTLIHWGVFSVIIYYFDTKQSVANLISFFVAVTFSFFINAKFTFKSEATSFKYLIFVTFMGVMAFTTGKIADYLSIPGIATLIFFSGISLVLGFAYSNFVVFK
ncbi:translocase [Escherichia coli]|uniref:GtrA family protein n=1 Tax=Escherichia coli TaxID=562 RepID=UPI0007519525|nr:GtrA family protein [Escherichia coli]KUV02335.1 translocase [Escherichia coli]MCN8868718.1 GtrA family protein [Escherichia coli]MCV2014021.1 GtrA family protein [Escherichia coli]